MASFNMTETQHDKVRGWVDTYLNPCTLTQELREEAVKSLHKHRPTLGFLPGTGLQSGALAHAYSDVGYPVITGSRSTSKAVAYATQLAKQTGNEKIEGADLAEAARRADIIFWLVPTTTESAWKKSIALLKGLEPQLKEKIVIDVTNILWFHDQSSWGQTSSTLLVSAALSPSSNIHLVSAFKHTYYRLITPGLQPPESNPHNVLVCADHAPAAAMVIALINDLSGFRGLYAGNLQYSKIVELLSPLWLAQLERDNFGSLFYAGWRFGI